MAFSARRIKTPKTGVFAMHPFVDVLEGRAFLSGSVHDGVLTTDDPAGGDAAPVDTADPDVAGALAAGGQVIDFDDGQPRGGHQAVREGLLGLHPPARVELTTASGELAFSVTQIGDGDDVVFGNLLYDRRGRGPTRALPAPAQEPQAAAAAGPFRDGRAFTGAMRPYLTATMSDTGDAFAA